MSSPTTYTADLLDCRKNHIYLWWPGAPNDAKTGVMVGVLDDEQHKIPNVILHESRLPAVDKPGLFQFSMEGRLQDGMYHYFFDIGSKDESIAMPVTDPLAFSVNHNQMQQFKSTQQPCAAINYRDGEIWTSDE